MRIFTKLREIIARNKEIEQRLSQLENKTGRHDKEIQSIFEAIRQLTSPQLAKPKRKIGFSVN